MNKNTVIIIALVVVLGIGGLIFMTGNNSQELPEDELTPQFSGELVEDEIEITGNPETVVALFMDNFIETAPPESDIEALNNALDLISDEAKMQFGDEPTSGDLAMFVGVQDIPDNGYQVSGVSFNQDGDQGTANVEVTLNYSGGESVKTFDLIKVNNNWVIDKIN